MSILASYLLAATDWSQYEMQGGSAEEIGTTLENLLASSNMEEASAAWDQIEERVFSQCTIYSVAEPAVAVMMAALTEDQPSWRSGRIMDLVFFVVTGFSSEDPELSDRCHVIVRAGFWLLASQAVRETGWAREGALEILEVVVPERVGELRKALEAR